MPRHGMSWSNGASPGLGKWVRGGREVKGGSRVAVEAQVGLGPLPFSVWATFDTLPAKCSIKCPQENNF
jgi:hypothetical protein